MSGKAICIDYGLKRIGLSISDDTMTIAFPYKYILNKNAEQNLEELKNIIIEENINVIIIGMPIGLRGHPTELSIKVEEFIEKLKSINRTALLKDIPIITYDERFSTAQARRSLIANNVKRKKRKEFIDSIAASLILQSYLDNQLPRPNEQGLDSEDKG